MPALTRKVNIELVNMPDCTGLSENGRCTRLGLSACKGQGCSHYTSRSSCEKAEKRLRELDDETQRHIAAKYYNGKRPWLEGADGSRR